MIKPSQGKKSNCQYVLPVTNMTIQDTIRTLEHFYLAPGTSYFKYEGFSDVTNGDVDRLMRRGCKNLNFT